MNKKLVIVIENKKEASSRGLLSRIKSFIKKHFSPRLKVLDQLLWLKEGDAIVIDLSKTIPEYSVESHFTQSLVYGYGKSSITYGCSSDQIYYLMSDYQIIEQLLNDIIEYRTNNKTIIEVVVRKPEPVRKPKRMLLIDVAEKIRIFERFVKIGLRTFKREFNVWTGEEYVVVDGDVFYIRNDRYGREYLDVN